MGLGSTIGTPHSDSTSTNPTPGKTPLPLPGLEDETPLVYEVEMPEEEAVKVRR